MGLGDARGRWCRRRLPTSFTRIAARVGLLQIEDQLRQVLNAVDVVVGRRRDERDAGGGVTDAQRSPP